jgi:hypothetical protein
MSAAMRSRSTASKRERASMSGEEAMRLQAVQAWRAPSAHTTPAGRL